MTADTARRAKEIVVEAILVDTHLDVPYRLTKEWEDVAAVTVGGDFDYPRAVAGGLSVAFMAAYNPPELEAGGGSKALVERMIDIVERVVADSPGKFGLAFSTEDVRRNFAAGLISLPIAMENGSPMEGDLANVRHFYERGVRYVTLCHNGTNHICDSSRDAPRWNGLSGFGVELVQEMNSLGMMVDVSHVSDATFWQVVKVSRVPIIASHSSARHFTPGFSRNMPDDMIVALAEKGGTMGINLGSAFLNPEANAYGYARWGAFEAAVAEGKLEDTSEGRLKFNSSYEAEHGPFPFADLAEVLDHFDHVVALVGADHVGIGSDFDGVGDTLPVGLKDVSCYPALIAGLLDRGCAEGDVRKIMGGNLLRVWGEVEAQAH